MSSTFILNLLQGFPEEGNADFGPSQVMQIRGKSQPLVQTSEQHEPRVEFFGQIKANARPLTAVLTVHRAAGSLFCEWLLCGLRRALTISGKSPT